MQRVLGARILYTEQARQGNVFYTRLISKSLHLPPFCSSLNSYMMRPERLYIAYPAVQC